MKIVEYPHPALFRPAREVRHVTGRLRNQVRGMLDAMYQSDGMALAANQVALPWRLIVMNPDIENQDKQHERVYINPRIVRARGKVVGEEGCLSFPGLFARIRRAAEVEVQAYDLDGNGIRVRVTGLEARAWQHELDHLDGKVFVDHFSLFSRLMHHGHLKAFESRFRKEQRAGLIPSTEEIERQLSLLANERSPMDEPWHEEAVPS